MPIRDAMGRIEPARTPCLGDDLLEITEEAWIGMCGATRQKLKAGNPMSHPSATVFRDCPWCDIVVMALNEGLAFDACLWTVKCYR